MNSKNTLKKSDRKIGWPESLLWSIGIFVLLALVILLGSHFLNLYEEYNEPEHNVFFLNVQTSLALVSSLLLVILLAQYLENFITFKTQFTLAFVIMAIVLLAHSITSNPILFSYFGYMPMRGPFSIIPLIFTTIAAFALLYLNAQ